MNTRIFKVLSLCLAMLLSAVMGGSLAATPMAGTDTTKGERAGLTRSGIAMASSVAEGWTPIGVQTSLAKLGRATRLGLHDLSDSISLTVSLKLRHVEELQHFLKAVQNPDSPLYHHFLTPEQFTARFGPTREQVAQVTSYLEATGIEVTGVSANRMLIHTRAQTQAYARAFRISINDYRLDGHRFSAPKTGLSFRQR